MMLIGTGLPRASPSKRCASPLRRVVLSTSSGVFLTTPGIQAIAMIAITRRNAPRPNKIGPKALRTVTSHIRRPSHGSHPRRTVTHATGECDSPVANGDRQLLKHVLVRLSGRSSRRGDVLGDHHA